MVCPEGKIENPLTGRCINECKQGQVLDVSSGKPKCKTVKKIEAIKQCPAGKVLNPATNRCILVKPVKVVKAVQPQKVIKEVNASVKPNRQNAASVKKNPMVVKVVQPKIVDKVVKEVVKEVKANASVKQNQEVKEVKIVQPQKTDEAENNTDYTQIILKNLKMMQQLEYKNKAPFKARAYTNVIKQIGELTRPIKTVDDVGKLGKGIKERIELIIKQGYLEETKEALENTSQFDAIEAFSNIMSIGPVKAKALVTEHNIKSIDELRKNQHLLNDKQKMGLRYYEDFLERIPRNEMDMHLQHIEKAIKQHDPDMTFQIVGSYRRGVVSSGDIDVLVTHPENKKDAFEKIIKHLKTTGYLVDDFASGKEKYLGVSKLENYPVNRRIDILYMDPHRFPFALLYFTGDKGFNVQLRNRALSLGYSLSEHGLKYTSGPNKNGIVDDDFKSERDIFTFLKAQYVEPKNRNQYAVKALLV